MDLESLDIWTFCKISKFFLHARFPWKSQYIKSLKTESRTTTYDTFLSAFPPSRLTFFVHRDLACKPGELGLPFFKLGWYKVIVPNLAIYQKMIMQPKFGLKSNQVLIFDLFSTIFKK